MELGKEKMTAAAEAMGFNRSFDLDGIPTSKSQYDVSDAEETNSHGAVVDSIRI